MREETLWVGTPSHVARLGTYLLCLLFCWLIVPIFIAIWTAIKLKSTRYVLTTERLRITEGIFSKRTEQVELYRVKDMSMEKPFIYRMFSKGNIHLITSDHSFPNFKLEAISDVDVLMDVLREHVEICRERKRVTEIDID
ncbi:PH domain-containing protein [Lihuaxuella thermophila]|uniref:PH domain-containing protein n=1 Tax=Lihuaxuella thermophila TaxID=1173111 RepID=A0A1H8AAF8_9BACL|nr:PH domain-containing protein [Lihuaxuella thermophila]SEM67561.1 PH domain-containing protein [Lihuaxuella thermophila]